MIAGIRLRDGALLRRLPVQLMVLMTAVLFPLGIISLVQTGQILLEARDQSRTALVERTIAAGSQERDLFRRALVAARALAVATETEGRAECRATLTRFVRAEPTVIAAQKRLADGELWCQSDSPEIAALPPGPVEAKTVLATSTRDGTPVIVVTAPDPGGSGHSVSLAIPAAQAEAALLRPGPMPERDAPFSIATINAAGTVLVGSGPQPMGPDHFPDGFDPVAIAASDTQWFEGAAQSGEARIYAVSPLIDGAAYLVGSWPQQPFLGPLSGPSGYALMVLPVLMWCAGMAVAYFGLKRLVVRHVTQLRHAMRQLAVGSLQDGRVVLDNPPAELQEAERAFNRMVALLSAAEERQAQDLRDKEVLLNEVRHRVKNNLQLIVSIINMQARGTDNHEARALLDSLGTRVRGLAATHQTISATPKEATVDIAALMNDLVRDVVGLSDDSAVILDAQIEPLVLYPDQAVPLSMLVAEAMTNAIKHAAGTPESPARITVSLRQTDDGVARLAITNTTPGEAQDVPAAGWQNGLGKRLMRAFEQQLRGTSNIVSRSYTYTYSLAFDIREFSPSQRA